MDYIEKRFRNAKASKTFNNIIRTFDLDQKAVLDIGCSYGEFLSNFGKGSVGITINNEEVIYGREHGLDIRFGNIESDDFVLTEKFDVIFANNIFEHLFSPHEFLCRIKKYLAPNGILILGVPCIPKAVFLLRFKKFRGSLSMLHINFFTKDTLTKTVERAGWQPFLVRGFHFMHPLIDFLFNPAYPHFYVGATVNTDFAYSDKRMKEIAGYVKVVTRP